MTERVAHITGSNNFSRFQFFADIFHAQCIIAGDENIDQKREEKRCCDINIGYPGKLRRDFRKMVVLHLPIQIPERKAKKDNAYKWSYLLKNLLHQKTLIILKSDYCENEIVKSPVMPSFTGTSG